MAESEYGSSNNDFNKELGYIEQELNRFNNSSNIKDLKELDKHLKNFLKFKKGNEDNLIKLTEILSKIHQLADGTGEENKLITEVKGLKNKILKNFHINKEKLKSHSITNDKNNNCKSSTVVNHNNEKSTLNLNPIEKKISNLEQTYNSQSKNIIDKIDNIKFPEFPTPPKIPTDYLKEDDFKFELNNKFNELKDLKELAENLETVPAKVNSIGKEIKSLSEKMDNLPSLNNSKNITNIPKEEKAVIDLAKYMNDGVAQFENIAKEYVSKIQELEKFEKAKAKHKEALEKVRIDATNEGKKEGQISLIKEISEKFPTSFDEIKSLCKEYIREEFKKDEEIEITNENQNDKMPLIEGEISLGKYKIITPAILLDDKIIIKAKVEEIKEQEKVNTDG